MLIVSQNRSTYCEDIAGTSTCCTQTPHCQVKANPHAFKEAMDGRMAALKRPELHIQTGDTI